MVTMKLGVEFPILRKGYLLEIKKMTFEGADEVHHVDIW